MADTTLVRDGMCPEHGAVRAVKEVPGPHFPFIVWIVQRATTPLRAFRCPQCDGKVRVTRTRDSSR